MSENSTGEIKVFGNNHWKELLWKVPEWKDDEHNPDPEDCFLYKCNVYFPSQFMTITEHSPFYLLDENGITLFDGYHSDSFFSGILIKYSDCGEAIKAFTYIS